MPTILKHIIRFRSNKKKKNRYLRSTEEKIINTKTAIFDEDYQHIAVGTSTYYIKSQS